MAEIKTVGNLNGAWAILFRMALATYPLVLTWAIWVTKEQFHDISFRNVGERFTNQEYQKHLAEEDLRYRELDAKVDALPPLDWRAKINSVEELARQNQAALIRIETLLQNDK